MPGLGCPWIHKTIHRVQSIVLIKTGAQQKPRKQDQQNPRTLRFCAHLPGAGAVEGWALRRVLEAGWGSAQQIRVGKQESPRQLHCSPLPQILPNPREERSGHQHQVAPPRGLEPSLREVRLDRSVHHLQPAPQKLPSPQPPRSGLQPYREVLLPRRKVQQRILQVPFLHRENKGSQKGIRLGFGHAQPGNEKIPRRCQRVQDPVPESSNCGWAADGRDPQPVDIFGCAHLHQHIPLLPAYSGCFIGIAYQFQQGGLDPQGHFPEGRTLPHDPQTKPNCHQDRPQKNIHCLLQHIACRCRSQAELPSWWYRICGGQGFARRDHKRINRPREQGAEGEEGHKHIRDKRASGADGQANQVLSGPVPRSTEGHNLPRHEDEPGRLQGGGNRRLRTYEPALIRRWHVMLHW